MSQLRLVDFPWLIPAAITAPLKRISCYQGLKLVSFQVHINGKLFLNKDLWIIGPSLPTASPPRTEQTTPRALQAKVLILTTLGTFTPFR